MIMVDIKHTVHRLLAARGDHDSFNGPWTEEKASAQDREQLRAIRNGVALESRHFRERHPLIHRFQNLAGLGVLLTGMAVGIGGGWAYIAGIFPAWVTILVVAFGLSLIHEVEHDLIHDLYFPKNRLIKNLMMLVCWIARPTQVSPWLRRDVHLEHHRISGTINDLEERVLSSGLKWNLTRFFMLPDTMLAVLLQNPPWRNPKVSLPIVMLNSLGHFPMAWIAHAILAIAGGSLILGSDALPASLVGPSQLLAVVWVLPNTFRTFCINFLTSNLHYFGDIRAGDLLRQTQVLNKWYFLPFQLFSFNFGATHSIHHFWYSEPFYIRQLTSARTLPILRANGVRFNDLGTFKRANRYRLEAKAPA